MTKAQILSQARYLINEVSGDTGALLSDTGNLLDFVDDAMEVLLMELLPFMPLQFCGTENITLVADQANYTLTAEWFMIYKIERNVTDKSPREIEIIDPLQHQYYTNVGETEASPAQCYILGDTFYFVKTPSTATTDYAKVYFVRPEATTIPTAGPTYIPRPFHRCIGYMAAALAAQFMGADPTGFIGLYQKRLEAGKRVWFGRFQSQPRFVQASIHERRFIDDRDRVLWDVDSEFWLD